MSKTVVMQYWLVTLQCPHHRGQNGIFKYNMMGDKKGPAAQLLKNCFCPKCGRFDTLKVIEQATAPSYEVPITI